jgi:hypothetical protein
MPPLQRSTLHWLHTEYLQAFIAGKATSGLTMASLRILSKGVMPQTLSGLRLSTVMCISIAGVLVLCCFLIAAIVLPRLKQQIADMQDKRPGAFAECFKRKLPCMEFASWWSESADC